MKASTLQLNIRAIFHFAAGMDKEVPISK